ncbi:MAG: ThiF family adenylyltransferase [Epsilonproteobacteria bacterium]|nr:ThiF family adenylyltransferase [Campylobacterota bacterium]
MQEYFKRQIQLWGEEKQSTLQKKKIAIIGAGGLGSSLCFALGASGIGEIHIIDFDEVSLHNIHRQIAFTLEDEGKNKAQVNAQIIRKRSQYTQAFFYECDFEQWSLKDIDVDLIIDATDNLPTRAQIDQYAKKKNIPWIYGSVEAFNGQVCFFNTAKFEDFFKVVKRIPAGIAAPIVMHIASLQANLAIRYLTGLNVKKDFVYYIYFNDEGEFISQKFSIKT